VVLPCVVFFFLSINTKVSRIKKAYMHRGIMTHRERRKPGLVIGIHTTTKRAITRSLEVSFVAHEKWEATQSFTTRILTIPRHHR